MIRDFMRELDPILKADEYSEISHIAVVWSFVRHLGHIKSRIDTTDFKKLAALRLNDWLLRKSIIEAFADYLDDHYNAYVDSLIVSVLCSYDEILIPSEDTGLDEIFLEILKNPDAREFLQVNLHNNVLWLNRERLDILIKALMFAPMIILKTKNKYDAVARTGIKDNADAILEAAESEGYQIEKIVKRLSGEISAVEES
jgi:hypothetical protein